MESTFSKKSRNEALDNFKFSKDDCCNISFLQGYFYRDQLSQEDEKIVHKPDILKSAKVVKKLLGIWDCSVCFIS